ncbi:hypothetical protein MPL3365_70037 [Mesorhizobium plurifarium]|uniref:Uncharacterized protein n=1 Tax=Mesorhizobium plurifarium TaxID=69974 RepID=A0A090GGS4_MESPL|nr:hypothetical protein MPL3365_70037 [Mesorhizobium plurifarium]
MATVMVDASTAISMRGLPAFHQPAGFISAAREGAAVTLVTLFSTIRNRGSAGPRAHPDALPVVKRIALSLCFYATPDGRLRRRAPRLVAHTLPGVSQP